MNEAARFVEQAEAAASVLRECLVAGKTIAALPPELRPTTRANGYAIQACYERWSNAPLLGWKIAATSVAGQAHIAVDGPLAGRLLTERVIPSGGVCPFGANQMRVAEIEFAFRMARTLAPADHPYAVDEVLDAVATLHPAIEIPDSRLSPFEAAGAPQLIADNACANYFTLGAAADDGWRALNLADHPVIGRVNDGPHQTGTGANVLGDPRAALAWLANELSSLGVPLRAGEVVTTGTCVIPMKIAPGDCIVGDLGPIGRVTVRMATE